MVISSFSACLYLVQSLHPIFSTSFQRCCTGLFSSIFLRPSNIILMISCHISSLNAIACGRCSSHLDTGAWNTTWASVSGKQDCLPLHALGFLGLELNSEKMEHTFPCQSSFSFEHSSWCGSQKHHEGSKHTCMLWELQELVRFLLFSLQVIPASQMYIHQLNDFSTSFTCPFSKQHIPTTAHADLAWWSTYAESWNGVCLLQQDHQTLHIHTDASGAKGIGVIFGADWYSAQVPCHICHAHIQVKELYAVLQALLHWGESWHGCHGAFHVDNSAVVDAINNHTIRSSPTMSLMAPNCHACHLPQHVFFFILLPSQANTITGAASCYQYAHLFILASSLNPQPSTMDPQPIGIRHILHSQLGVSSSSGTASCPQLNTCTAWGSANFLTSSSSTPIWPTMTAPHCQLPGSQSWNGWPSWASGPCNPPQSNSTFVMSAPSMSTTTCPLRPVMAYRSNGSFMASRGILGNVTRTQYSPSPLISFTASLL